MGQIGPLDNPLLNPEKQVIPSDEEGKDHFGYHGNKLGIPP